MTTDEAAPIQTSLPGAGAGARTFMRSGTAARLAGISPSTLRIWEHRYGVVSPPKSPSGQRTYSMEDIQRLRLIKRLTQEGHAIGTVATLDIHELVLLSPETRTSSTAEQRVVVVGQAAAHKLEGRLRPSPVLVFDDLGHAEREVARCGAADVLAVHLHSLHPSMTERVLALRTNLPTPNVVVVYSFGAETVADALRVAGVTVRREPITGKELARLIVALKPLPPAVASGTRTSPRRYTDAELVSLAEMPSMVLCECPRHLAEIVTLLVGFERYSAECESRSPTDAALHRHLLEVTGIARTMFEQALARVVIDEGLVL
jgi:MerR family transcriptional regulator, light-induced transcriptional regulator